MDRTGGLQGGWLYLTVDAMKRMLVFLLVCFSGAAWAQQGIFELLAPKEFIELVYTRPEAVLLDLRTPDELKEEGIIRGATHLDYFQRDFEDRVSKLDKSKTYFVYCAGGGRSGETLELMKKAGFKEVYDLKGGVTAWKRAGLPLERKSDR